MWVILYVPDPANTQEINFMQNSFYIKFHRNLQSYKEAQKKKWF